MTRSFMFIFAALAVTACHPQRYANAERTDDDDYDLSPAPEFCSGPDLTENAIDVCGDMFGVGIEQLPDGGNPSQAVSWYGFGCGHDGDWQGSGCFTGLPVNSGGRFTGIGGYLDDDMLFRGGCALTGQVDEGAMDPDSDAWCDHDAGIDTVEEDRWILHFMECGIQKANVCVKRINGISYPAKDECWADYVPPESCPAE